MNQYQGGNEESSILVLDNAWTHHEHEVRRVCHDAGVGILFLPPYSPKIAPHEKCIRAAKDWMRTNNATIESLSVPQRVDIALAIVSSSTMRSALRECGYLS